MNLLSGSLSSRQYELDLSPFGICTHEISGHHITQLLIRELFDQKGSQSVPRLGIRQLQLEFSVSVGPSVVPLCMECLQKLTGHRGEVQFQCQPVEVLNGLCSQWLRALDDESFSAEQHGLEEDLVVGGTVQLDVCCGEGVVADTREPRGVVVSVRDDVAVPLEVDHFQIGESFEAVWVILKNKKLYSEAPRH